MRRAPACLGSKIFSSKISIIPWKVAKNTWAQNLTRLEKETQKIVLISNTLTEQDFQTRILIPRLRGMEDSSRFWSVALTIEHLCVSLSGMSNIASELAKGNRIEVDTGTANIKPKQENLSTKPKMLEKFETLVKETVDILSVYETPSEKHKVHHPWFGNISANGWVWTIGQHQSLHRKQIQMIVERL